MKIIYFIRHAKAKKIAATDFDRPLNSKGKKAAKLMAGRLKSKKILPELIISSPAKRTAKTAKIIAKNINFNGKIKFEKSLYEANTQDYLKLIWQIDNSLNSVFIIGHNDTLTQICEILSDSHIGNIPTGGVFGIEFDVKEFKEIGARVGRVLLFDYPKKIE
ncbi:MULTISPECIES: SixA phosphatase family protein [Campylobacter]|uniref:Histidine phosphatase family protein n=1 Tax=Campylobacter porcelli TaxID=1660073 RepID=A0ABU7M2V4_9BACT|nr:MULTISPECIES: histidine phosphatase family protein [unclassified Campylobacter]MCR8678394.1 histidine phosphatase family protein [Campylobacter sp. RM19072]MCR8695746.1 histidine phosphatase family protein [Campylobacter sp. RM19073]MEE3704252.1 histidine phosphatase family protein [Campylobacter sp. CX2-8023-23]MEE3743899.1 histidine phosphatase family protein [Campylobacter sp. CX2-4855-23]MEE3776158.1 histidine phosphatase family protein [Campylobacter sp. CX2-4080-23]